MKRVFIFFVLCFSALSVIAQVYNSIVIYDKFDDVIKSETRKTLITRTDSTFIIEEKGKQPTVYFILTDAPYNTFGDKDNIVNLGGDVYGYQVSWCVIKNEDKEVFFNEMKNALDGELPKEQLQKYFLFAVHRFISKLRSSFYYESELFWIENETPEDNKLGKDVNRIIYVKQ